MIILLKSPKLFKTLLLLNIGFISFAQDWQGIEVPAKLEKGFEWELQKEISDDFNYTFKATSKNADFGPKGQDAKWNNFFHNPWKGPGATIWSRDHASVEGGNLRILASRVSGETKTFGNNITRPATRSGCITSKKTVKFPVYVEGKIKILNSCLASDIWLLSPDDTQEIDIIECYGGKGDDNRNAYFSERLHLSHHVFERQPFKDYQPADLNSWYRQKGLSQWGGRTIRIGVYWKNETTLEYYIDGQLVRVVDNNAIQTRNIEGGFDYTYPAGIKGGQIIREKGYQKVIKAASLEEAKKASKISVIDPFDYLKNGRKLDKELEIIINVEDQSWQALSNRSPNGKEIKNKEDHTMLVDWLRVYKPVPSKKNKIEAITPKAGVSKAVKKTVSESNFAQSFSISKSTNENTLLVKSEGKMKKLFIHKATGGVVKTVSMRGLSSKVISTSELELGNYVIQVEFKDGYRTALQFSK